MANNVGFSDSEIFYTSEKNQIKNPFRGDLMAKAMLEEAKTGKRISYIDTYGKAHIPRKE